MRNSSARNRPQLVSSTEVYRGPAFWITTDYVLEPSGVRARRDVVRHTGSVVIMPVQQTNSELQVLLVRQYRHPAGRFLWELPAGTAEPGEDPASGAARELREETGYGAGRLTLLGSSFTTPGFCEELMYFYHAQDLQPGEQSLDEDERIDVGCFSLASAWQMVRAGQIADVKTLLGLLWLSQPSETRGAFGR